MALHFVGKAMAALAMAMAMATAVVVAIVVLASPRDPKMLVAMVGRGHGRVTI